VIPTRAEIRRVCRERKLELYAQLVAVINDLAWCDTLACMSPREFEAAVRHALVAAGTAKLVVRAKAKRGAR
jgi:hypothetical protein